MADKQPASKEQSYLEWRRRDDPHQDQPWQLVLVASRNDAWTLLNAPAPLETRGPAHEPRPDAVEALRPFVELYEKVDERYRKRGGTPDQFKDSHPFADIPAADLPMGVWRRAQAAFRATPPPAASRAMLREYLQSHAHSAVEVGAMQRFADWIDGGLPPTKSAEAAADACMAKVREHVTKGETGDGNAN